MGFCACFLFPTALPHRKGSLTPSPLSSLLLQGHHHRLYGCCRMQEQGLVQAPEAEAAHMLLGLPVLSNLGRSQQLSCWGEGAEMLFAFAEVRYKRQGRLLHSWATSPFNLTETESQPAPFSTTACCYPTGPLSATTGGEPAPLSHSDGEEEAVEGQWLSLCLR